MPLQVGQCRGRTWRRVRDPIFRKRAAVFARAAMRIQAPVGMTRMEKYQEIRGYIGNMFRKAGYTL